MPAFQDGVCDFTGYPSAPVLWLNSFLDTLCVPLQCSNWRQLLGVPPGSLLSHPIPYMADLAPAMMTYTEFIQQDPIHRSFFSLQSLYQYAFETESTSLGLLTTPTALLTLLVFMLLIRNIKAVLKPIFLSIGRQAARQTQGPDWELIPANQARIVKFSEYLFRLLYHSIVSIYGVWYFWDKPWWAKGGSLSLFREFPSQPLQPGMAWYYLLQAAYNLDAMVTLLEMSFQWRFQSPWVQVQTSKLEDEASTTTTVACTATKWRSPVTVGWSPTVRGDFREMFIHHLVTNVLIIGSSHFRLTRTGSMVFLVHDLSDVPVDLSKLANFLKWKVTTIICFLTMVVVWMATRLYALPFIIYPPVLFQSHYLMESGFSPIMYICYRHMFYVLMGFLIFLHVVWFGMFLQILYTMITKNENHDYSEHKHGEQPHSFQQLHHHHANGSNSSSTNNSCTTANGTTTTKPKAA